jgi:trans-aconitate methyltransferase
MWNAKLYDDKHSFVWKHGADVVELLSPRSGERILDIGCGTGHLTAKLAQAGALVLGIDRSEEMIAEARRNYPGLTFEVLDARNLNQVDHFDAVFSNAVLHWIPEAKAVVRGVARALKPGGRFVAEFGGKGNIRVLQGALTEAVAAVTGAWVESPWYFPSVAEYAGLLEKYGLEVTFATLFDRPTPLEGENGLRNWVEMFGGPFLALIAPERREAFFGRVENQLRPVLKKDGVWFADYRRIRVLARRPVEAA